MAFLNFGMFSLGQSEHSEWAARGVTLRELSQTAAVESLARARASREARGSSSAMLNSCCAEQSAVGEQLTEVPQFGQFGQFGQTAEQLPIRSLRRRWIASHRIAAPSVRCR